MTESWRPTTPGLVCIHEAQDSKACPECKTILRLQWEDATRALREERNPEWYRGSLHSPFLDRYKGD